jgi:DNA-directed RNA polymerase subunit M/transcription elongation factor TFIIS
MVLKCTECGNLLKKESITEDQIIICPICDSQYKVTSAPDGKQRLEEFTFGGNDPGEL